LVAVSADARTREQIDWLAEEIIEAGGVATVWLAIRAAPRRKRDRRGDPRHLRCSALLRRLRSSVGPSVVAGPDLLAWPVLSRGVVTLGRELHLPQARPGLALSNERDHSLY
jgi:hypothetical protein